MGIHCEINLFKPSDGAYVPGSVVSGAIKYAFDEETVFDKITVSLKGNGYVIIHDERRKKRDKISTFRDSEDYVDIDNVIHNNEKGTSFQIGCYKTEFSFRLPEEIPASMTYFNRTPVYRVHAKIMYYVRIKFDRPGFMKFSKRFKKELTVVTGIRPKLSTEPIMYGAQRKLFQLLQSKNSIVNIKASINNSVIPPGGRLEFNYELFNDTNLTLKGVETKIIEMYTFKPRGYQKVEMVRDIKNTDAKTGTIGIGESQSEHVIISIPTELTSLEFSRIISREYFVYINTIVPFPHRNVGVQIPVQIGEDIQTEGEVIQTECEEIQSADDAESIGRAEAPPSYWEAMGEDDEKKELLEEK